MQPAGGAAEGLGLAALPGAFLGWLEAGAVGRAMRQEPLLFPAVEIVHILGFALLLGSIAVLDLRLLGWRRAGVAAGRLAAATLPLSLAGFALALPSGLALLTTEASATGRNPVFLIKLGLIALAGLNALILHLTAWRAVDRWPDAPPPAARLAALASLLLWTGVVILGRLIAYY